MKFDLTSKDKYVVVSISGPTGNWYEGFKTKDEAKGGLHTKYPGWDTLYLLTLDEFLDEYSREDGEDDEWNKELDTFLCFEPY